MLTQILVETPRYRLNYFKAESLFKPRDLHKPLDRQSLVVLDEESYNVESVEELPGIVI